MNVIQMISKVNNPNLDGFTLTVPVIAPPASLVLSEHESMTDYGNAQRFIHQHGKKVFYCRAEDTWYIWDGRVWKPDADNQLEIFAQNTARSILAEAQRVLDAKYRANLEKWGRSSLNHSRFTKMLKAACVHLPVSVDQFDTNRWLFGVDNGTIDLKTGALLPWRRDDLITKSCNVKYVPKGACPQWLKFLDRIFNGDADLIRFVQKMVGYCMTGDVSEKCFFILLGEQGDNGKTVFVNVMSWLLGDYTIDMPIDSLLQRKPGASSNDLVRLKGSRFISCSEANRQHYFDEALVKRLTGSDPITARAMYKEFITFKPEGKIVIATNRVPKFDKADTALGNRIRMIPFDVTIPKEEQDLNLFDKLVGEGEGILSWAVEGCLLWQRESLGAVPVVQPEIEIRPDCSLETFIGMFCEVAEEKRCRTSDLYSAYLGYHEALGGTDPLSLNTFGVELSKLGIGYTHTNNGNCRTGIALKSYEKDV